MSIEQPINSNPSSSNENFVQTVDCFLDELTELSTSALRQPFYELLTNRLQNITNAESVTIWIAVDEACVPAVSCKQKNTAIGDVGFNLTATQFSKTVDSQRALSLDCDLGELIVAPVVGASDSEKVISIHCQDLQPQLKTVYRDLLDAVADIAVNFERRLAVEQQSNKFEKLEKLLELHRNSNSTLDLESTGFHICNDCRAFFSADRVWLFTSHGRANLLACSSVTDVNRRSKSVRQLTRVVETAVRSGKSRHAIRENETEQDEQLQAYLTSENIRSLHVQILKNQHQSVAGAIVIEFREQNDSMAFAESMKFVLPTIQSAFNNAERYSRLPFRRSLNAIGWFISQFQAGRLLRTICLILLAAAVLSSLFLVKNDFEIQVNGELRPVDERHVFAPADAIVRSVDVQYGQQVETGQVIAQLDSKEYQLKINELQNELSAANKQLEANKLLRSQAAKEGKDSVYLGQLSAEIEQNLLQIESINQNTKWFMANNAELQLKSPIDGQVITRDPRLKLLRRPVVSGNRLLTIADTNAQWQIVFEVPDRDFGYLLQAKRDGDVQGWAIEYRLKSDLESSFISEISDTDQNNSFDDEGNSFVRVFVPVDKDVVRQLRVGQSVDGKINCGRKSLFFIWTRDIRDFLRSNFFWM